MQNSKCMQESRKGLSGHLEILRHSTFTVPFHSPPLSSFPLPNFTHQLPSLAPPVFHHPTSPNNYKLTNFRGFKQLQRILFSFTILFLYPNVNILSHSQIISSKNTYIFTCTCIFYINVIVTVQLLSHIRCFATPWTAACQACLSFTMFQSLLKLMFIESVMPSTISSSVAPFFSCPQLIV